MTFCYLHDMIEGKRACDNDCAWHVLCVRVQEIEERLNELELREEEFEDRADKQ
jgi:hypothetical protein